MEVWTCVKKIEHARQHLGRETDAVVGNRDDRFVAAPAGRDANAPAFARVLGGIRQEIHEDLLQPRGVAAHGERRLRIHRDVVLLVRHQRLGSFHRAVEHGAQLQSFGPQFPRGRG